MEGRDSGDVIFAECSAVVGQKEWAQWLTKTIVTFVIKVSEVVQGMHE